MDHPDVATSYENIGLVYKNKGNYSNALKYYVMCCEIRKNSFGKSDDITKTSIENIKNIVKELGKENDLPDWMKNNLNN